MNQKLCSLISTAGGIGYLPKAPGTWGSLVGLSAWWTFVYLTDVPAIVQGVVISLIILIGTFAAGKMITAQNKDPQYVVIDEVAGMIVSLILLPMKPVYFIAAFILFRFFDIVKPLGIRSAGNAKGGWGIMVDDLLAGVYTNLLIQLYIFFVVQV